MHNFPKTYQLNKANSRNRNIKFPQNASIEYLSISSVLHSDQLHINRKYVNNGDLTETSLLQYQRTSHLQVNNKMKDESCFQKLNRQQQCVIKPLHHQHYLAKNWQQKGVFTQPLQRKIKKSQQVQNSDNNFEVNQMQNLQDVKASLKTVNNQVYECNLNSYNPKQKFQYKKIPNKCENENAELLNDHIKSNIGGPSFARISNVTETYRIESFIREKSKIQEHKMEKANNFKNALSEDVNICNINKNSIQGAREKTPMCLINDLARFNKIPFQYRLTSENGPAHCKRFTVTLKLGSEEYTAEGYKIKQAQHLAAKEAIQKTKYKHPIPKTSRHNDDNVAKCSITPTVELNALAMKLGQQTHYVFDPTEIALNEDSFTSDDVVCLRSSANLFSKSKAQQTVITVNDFFGTCHDRLSRSLNHATNLNSLVSSRFPPAAPCKITLIIGTKKFLGIGRTIQQAKHNAAFNALQVLKQQINNDQIEMYSKSLKDIGNKSPISLVFEIGIKRNLPVDFKVLREKGPAHMRTFITACIVGDIITEAEGTGKKVSKKKAAQKMLEELEKLPPLTPLSSPEKRVKLKIVSKKVKSPPLKNMKLSDSKAKIEQNNNKHKEFINDKGDTNPIIKLLQWHQNRNEKEPIFKLISGQEKKNSSRRHFIMEVSSNEIVAHGVGKSKKLAKHAAAQNFLIAASERDEIDSIPQKNDFLKSPKLLEVKSNKVSNSEICSHAQICDEAINLDHTMKTCQKPERENKCISRSALISTQNSRDSSKISSEHQNLHMKDKLLYLAKILDFEVDFSDYPKGNHNEFLTIVMLSTNPPQICHGVGVNASESQDDAAKNALKILSDMGLNNAVKST